MFANLIRNLKINLWLKELLLFGATQVLGVAVAKRYLFGLAEFSDIPAISFRFGITDFVISAAIIGLFVWATIRRDKAGRIIYRLFFFLVIMGGGQIIFSAFFSPLITLWLTVLLIVAMITVKQVMAQNVLVMMAIAGVGLVIGLSVTPLMAVWALLILSFYDILAVYVTKHMVRLAEGMVEAGAVFGFIIPMQFSGWRESVRQVKPGDKFMILGSGDIALPLILAVSLVRISMVQAWTVAIFSMAGLFCTHLLFVNQKQRRPMAALPPIAMMAIVGYLVALIL